VWNTADYRKQYVGVLGSATAQQVVRKNNSAWQSFFAARENDEDAAPPGHWGNEDDRRELRMCIRNEQYTPETGEVAAGKSGRLGSERRVRAWLPRTSAAGRVWRSGV
jgi:hypothetical protein